MPQLVSVHPSPQQLAALSLGQLEDKEAQPVAEHVANCNTCRQVVENTPPDSFLNWLRIAHSSSPAPVTEDSPPVNAVETTDQKPACSPAAESSVLLPAQFGRYHILRKLGEGGMGAVYLARDTQLDRQVALKVPHFRPGTNAPVFERFCREARTAAVFDHPNLCPVYDVGCIESIHYLTMPYIKGKSLAEYIVAGKPLPPRKMAALVRKLALALQEAHSRGVIHRDLKPANIMINQRQEPIIMDFGLARLVSGADKLTAAGTLLGTPAYMSPEQVQGEPEAIGPGCDIYALGVILYQLLTGRLPFEGPIPGVLVRILTAEPPPVSHWLPEVDPALDAICRQAMAKQVADRPGSMSELANALTAYLHADNPAQPSQAALATSSKQPSAPSKKPASSRHQDLPPPEVSPVSVELAQATSAKSHKGWRQFLPHWPRRVRAASALILIALGLFFFLRTPDGLLKIEVNDHRLEIAIDGRNITIDKPVPLKPGEHQLAVKVGNVNLPVGTKMRLHSSDQKLTIRLGDMELTSDKFTFISGKDQVLKITLLPQTSPQDETKIGQDVTKAVAERILPSLVLVKVLGDSRTPLGVVTVFGVATVMPGSFAEVELLTLDKKETFTGKVISRKPFPFCWIDSPAVKLRPARTQGTVPKPQNAFLVIFHEGKAKIVEGKIATSGIFSTPVEIAPTQKGVVAPGPIFSAEGTCLGLSLRSDWNMPLAIYPLKQN